MMTTRDKRVRTGCATCRKRRVKCDEAKPTCARCKAANFICTGYEPQRHAVNSCLVPLAPSAIGPVTSPPEEITSFPELSWSQTSFRRDQLPLYHHFVTTTVNRLFRNDHITFWRDDVAQMSFSLDLVHEALLAIGAMHRASLIQCQTGCAQEAARFKVLGFRAYGSALHLLPKYLLKNTANDTLAVLIVLVLLAYFECFMENPKGAFRHLWAAIQLFRQVEERFTDENISNLIPIYDAMLRLDFTAQKYVPYSLSSFTRCSDLAIMEKPFWNRPSPQFSRSSYSDHVAGERFRLTQLICAHNKLSRVVWGSLCPLSERPSRDELLGFYSEMMLWKKTSPAIFTSCDGLKTIESFTSFAPESLPMPPPLCFFDSNEAALTIAMFNNYLTCTLMMLSETDENPIPREVEIYHLVYQNLCITAGLVERHKNPDASQYKPCDSITSGITTSLHHGLNRCYSLAWQKWIIYALRSIGREGLTNGYTSANTLEIMCRLDERRNLATTENAYLGPLNERLYPLLLPRLEDGRLIAFYLRHDTGEMWGDEREIHVVARATWLQNNAGNMESMDIDLYDPSMIGDISAQKRPQSLKLFNTWRHAVEKGWHGYLATDVREELLETSQPPDFYSRHLSQDAGRVNLNSVLNLS